METKKSKSLIAYGFAIVIAIIVVLIVVWIDSVSENKEYLESIRLTQDELYHITAMVNKVNDHSNLVRQLVDTKDQQQILQFERQLHQSEQQIQRIISKLNAASQHMISPQLWQKSKTEYQEYIGRATEVLKQFKINPDQTKSGFLNDLISSHDKIVATLQNQLGIYRTNASAELKNAIDRNDIVYYMIVLLGTAALLLGLLNILVVRQTHKNEAALYDQGQRIRRLYEITAKPGLSTEEQIREILKLGCKLLGMEIGKVCKIDKVANTNSFLNVYAPKGFSVCAGTVMPLHKTFCSITTTEEEPVAIHNVAISKYAKEFSHLSAYIATSIMVHGEEWGSINFSANAPRATPFIDADKDLMKLIGAWVSSALERRFAQEELLIAKNDAEAASRTKSAFLANMSHELRTPLNAIIGYSELLKEEAEYNQHTMYDEDLHKINSSALHLLALIDDILDLSKIEAGKMEIYMEDFSVGEVVEEVKATVQPLMLKNNNKFELKIHNDLGTLHADKLKVKQVLLNLLSNASKFTEYGSVKLHAKRETNKNDEKLEQIVFHVEDTGIGISDEQISKIFQAFSQADASTTSKFGGTGLGLAISRHICQLMGGDIMVKGAIGQGSTFTVKLPIISAKAY